MKTILQIEGMTCSACSSGLEKYLNKQKGILKASVNLVMAQASIEYEPTLKIKDLEKMINDAGFKSLGVVNPNKIFEKEKAALKQLLIIYGILILFLLYISMGEMLKLPSIPLFSMEKNPFNYSTLLLILTIPFLIYGLRIFQMGLKNLIHKTPNMDTLVTISVFASFSYSLYNYFLVLNGNLDLVCNLYFESVAMIIYFIKLGRYIEFKSREKTKDALKKLVELTPSKALVKVQDKEIYKDISEVKVSDILIAKPGMKFAVDGVITKGEAHINEAFLTGEARPLKKKINDKVLASSLNLDGYIEYQALKIGRDSTISEVVRLVIEAIGKKSKLEQLADKVSSYFVPSILVIAFLTLIVYLLIGTTFLDSLLHFVSVLLVACPCALGLATPLAIVVAISEASISGILIKSGEVIEQTSLIDTIIFDKTGTLTYGNLKIAKIFNYSNYDNKELMQILASCESKSNHPIALAFKNYALENKLPLEEVNDFQEISGYGIRATFKNDKYYLGNEKLVSKLKVKNNVQINKLEAKIDTTMIYVIKNHEIIALISVADIIRSDASDTISKLKKEFSIIMLTGDNQKSAKMVGDELKIKQIYANLSPKDKNEFIKELISKKKKIMMVGDGINDAPSLALSLVGVSFKGASDIATSSADVILLHDKLEDILNLIKISKKTLKIIKQNLFWAFFYNILMIPLAIGVFAKFNLNLNPTLSSLSMTISSLTVVLNSLRIKKWRMKK